VWRVQHLSLSRVSTSSQWAVRLSWLENAASRYFFGVLGIMTSKVGQGDLFLECNKGSSVGLCTQNYKSLCAVVSICATLVNMQTQ